MSILKFWKQKRIELAVKCFVICGCLSLTITGCAGISEQEISETSVEQIPSETSAEQLASETSDEQKNSETSDEKKNDEKSIVQDAEVQQEIALTTEDDSTSVAEEMSSAN